MGEFEELYNTEINNFNEEWEGKFKLLQDKSKISEEQLNEKHQIEMNDLLEQLEILLPRQMRFSLELQKLQTEEQLLVKGQR